MATWKEHTASCTEKKRCQAECSIHLAVWRQKLVVQLWRLDAAEGGRLKRTCALLLSKWGGQTQAAVFLSWQASARAQAQERYGAQSSHFPTRTAPIVPNNLAVHAVAGRADLYDLVMRPPVQLQFPLV